MKINVNKTKTMVIEKNKDISKNFSRWLFDIYYVHMAYSSGSQSF